MAKIPELDIIEKVDGWLSRDEMEYLARMSKAQSDKMIGNIVEIGTWKGKSAMTLAIGIRMSKCPTLAVTTIDKFTGSWEHEELIKKHILNTTYPYLIDNLRVCGLFYEVMPIIGNSCDVAKTWNLPIALLFIDGSHDYESVKKGFMAWRNFVVPGGVILLHDGVAVGSHRADEGVEKFLNELKKELNGLTVEDGAGSIACLRMNYAKQKNDG